MRNSILVILVFLFIFSSCETSQTQCYYIELSWPYGGKTHTYEEYICATEDELEAKKLQAKRIATAAGVSEDDVTVSVILADKSNCAGCK